MLVGSGKSGIPFARNANGKCQHLRGVLHGRLAAKGIRRRCQVGVERILVGAASYLALSVITRRIRDVDDVVCGLMVGSTWSGSLWLRRQMAHSSSN